MYLLNLLSYKYFQLNGIIHIQFCKYTFSKFNYVIKIIKLRNLLMMIL